MNYIKFRLEWTDLESSSYEKDLQPGVHFRAQLSQKCVEIYKKVNNLDSISRSALSRNKGDSSWPS